MRNIKDIILFSKPLHRYYWLLALLIVFSAILALITPLIYKKVIDDIIAQQTTIQTVLFWVGIAFAIGALENLLSSISNRLGDYTAGRLNQYLTEQFYAKVLSLNQDFFDSKISGKISNQLARGMEVIKGFTNTVTNFILPSVLQTVLILSILFYYNLYIGLFIAVLFPIYYALTRFSTTQWGKHEEAKNKLEDVTRGRINEVLGAMRLVKSFTNELREHTFVSKKLSGINAIYDKQSTTFHKIDFLRNMSLNLILTAVSVIVFSAALNKTMTIGTVLLIFQYISMARRPLFAMSFILTQVQHAESGSKEFFEIMRLQSPENIFTKKRTQRFVKPHIEFRNVQFSYQDSDKIINNMSFTVQHPQTVALVGHSGAGKSTIINLLLKLYQPQKGSILLNGVEYTQLDAHTIRQHISLVFQDSELFSTSIRENVAYGKPSATDADIITALKQAQAWEFVKKFDKQLDTDIGERGVKLSGGQKQRIQIARAMLHNAPILILDEATSNLDSLSEMKVQVALEKLIEDKLVIIIAHRFSTIQNVDTVLVINNGTVADMGTPKELANKKGIYSELLSYQIAGDKKLLQEFELL